MIEYKKKNYINKKIKIILILIFFILKNEKK
jgi:hypothetical protein